MIATAAPRQEHAVPPLALLLVVSLLLHLLLLWLLHATPQPATSSRALSVTLMHDFSISGASDTPATTAAPTPAAPPPRTHPLLHAAAATAAPPATAEPIVTADEEVDEAMATGERARHGQGQNLDIDSAITSHELTAALRAQIATRFAEHFHYPAIAQQRNWQGTVVLSFRVEADGSLGNIEVVESSGFGLLDKAAIESLRALGRIEFAPGSALQRTLELRLPVVYHLARG